MKALSKYALAIAMLVSIPAKAIELPKMEVMKTIMGIGMIGAAAVQLYTQDAASKAELEKRRSVMDEEPMAMAWRIWTERIVGQLKKEKKLVRMNQETGKMEYEEYPATGLVGTTANMMKENCMPITCAVVTLSETRKKIKEGLDAYGVSSYLERILNLMEVPSFAKDTATSTNNTNSNNSKAPTAPANK